MTQEICYVKQEVARRFAKHSLDCPGKESIDQFNKNKGDLDTIMKRELKEYFNIC